MSEVTYLWLFPALLFFPKLQTLRVCAGVKGTSGISLHLAAPSKVNVLKDPF